jgi:hypothetical protein
MANLNEAIEVWYIWRSEPESVYGSIYGRGDTDP